ncbi:Helix-turn-helix domain of resolvase [Maioricimonas rarisocia]|uniref:Helix-turn-helix domain of resolvase n=1 Tax=Maioricimonas rarisocia TaxID=2528026 RepID=A0A517Z9Q3_9PLAN|nr:helix-turn-helix domain-containing protein [Maioricimonas rarisocia]QDU39218.1 Helix-turn-helix domain of resolvase [Maioricimonas rarisocia]
MSQDGTEYDDDHIALLVAAGQSVAAVAEQTGVSRRTIYRRLEQAEFRTRVRDLRADMVDQAAGYLSRTAVKAVRTMESLLDSDSDTVRLGAARSILETGMRLRESAEFAQRLADVEARLEGPEPLDFSAAAERARNAC